MTTYPIKSQALLPGELGAKQTLAEMKRLTVEAIQSQIPRTLALQLIGNGSIRNPDIFVGTLRRWILMCVNIVDEFEELLISPLVMLQEISETGHSSGDCDDISMLAGAILASIGAQIRFQTRFQQPDGSYAHVFCQYKFPEQDDYLDFDPTIGYMKTYYDGPVLNEDVVS